VIVSADKGYHGADELITPHKGKDKPESQKDANRSHSAYAAPANASAPSSKPGASHTSCAAAHIRPATWPRPST
jgi:hypothetical protein